MPEKPDDIRTERDPQRFGLIPRTTASPLAPKQEPDTLIYDAHEDAPVRAPTVAVLPGKASGPEPPAAARPLVERVAHFRVIGKIGEGGMGCVYRAVDE